MNTGQRIGQELLQEVGLNLLYPLTRDGVKEARQREAKVVRCSCEKPATISGKHYVPVYCPSCGYLTLDEEGHCEHCGFTA